MVYSAVRKCKMIVFAVAALGRTAMAGFAIGRRFDARILPGPRCKFAVLADEAFALGDARRVAGAAQLSGIAGMAFKEGGDFLPIFGGAVDRSIRAEVILQAGQWCGASRSAESSAGW
jgi:hypothetical protein